MNTLSQPTYYVRHPDGSYSVADPQPVLGLTAESAEQREHGRAATNELPQFRSTFTPVTNDTPPAGVPDDVIKDAEKRGYLEALHDLAFRAANHWHGIPSVDASMKIERNVVMAWCEEAEKKFDAAMLSAAPQPEDIPAIFKEQAS